MKDPKYQKLLEQKGGRINKQKKEKRFKLLMGEIMSGNDNKKLVNEFKKKLKKI